MAITDNRLCNQFDGHDCFAFDRLQSTGHSVFRSAESVRVFCTFTAIAGAKVLCVDALSEVFVMFRGDNGS